MPEAHPDPNWPEAVSAYIRKAVPRGIDREGWDHRFSTAYQNGCEALVRLGQARETRWGAVPLDRPEFPEVLPRFDDICVVVLRLAHQRGDLVYHLPDGTLPAEEVNRFILRKAGSPRRCAGMSRRGSSRTPTFETTDGWHRSRRSGRAAMRRIEVVIPRCRTIWSGGPAPCLRCRGRS